MTLTSKSLRRVINILSQKLLEDDSPFVRAKASRCLGELGTEKVIKPLCQALEQEKIRLLP